MKAYMSDPWDEQTYYDEAWILWREPEQRAIRQADALREARAILAETEPMPEGFSQAGRLHRIASSEIAAGAFVGDVFPALWNAERALADALSAFIEREF